MIWETEKLVASESKNPNQRTRLSELFIVFKDLKG